MKLAIENGLTPSYCLTESFLRTTKNLCTTQIYFAFNGANAIAGGMLSHFEFKIHHTSYNIDIMLNV
jgi:hypothetical protein